MNYDDKACGIKLMYRTVGMLSTNCYFIINDVTNEAIIVDPGDASGVVERYADSNGLVPKAILLTHGHFDHIIGADTVRSRYSIPVYAPEAEDELMSDAKLNMSQEFQCACSVKADYYIKDKETITLAGITFTAIATPGHTQGSMCYHIPDANILISGDTLFCETTGRTDLPTGNSRQMLESVHRLLELPSQTKVYPGHGEETMIAHEREYNPFAGHWD